MSCRFRQIGMLALLVGAGVIHSGCPGHSGGYRTDDEDYDYEDNDDGDKPDDGDRPRARRRRTRASSKAEVLIDARRLSDAVVDISSDGRPGEDVNSLRRNLCDGREDENAIFYQLVVSTHWHYYWTCARRSAQRAATARGNRLLLRWVKRIQARAESESAACGSAGRDRLLSQVHESGTRATAYCDGRLVLAFPDGGKRTRTFRVAAGASVAPTPAPPPDPSPESGGRLVCPVCPTCPRVHTRQTDCPRPTPCPAPTPCPPPKRCDCSGAARAAGEKAFWQGVNKACKRICTLVYKKCRAIDPKTALCYQVSEYCATTCAKR